eukprot:NODE_792_length_3855_cov_0.702688.p1 type:complete len:601 gc:universal NODE_792_length_3855_cov_0.702688:1353-3155(+)
MFQKCFQKQKIFEIPISSSCYYHIRSFKEEGNSLTACFIEELPLCGLIVLVGVGSAYFSLKIPETTGKIVNIIAKSLQGGSLKPLKKIAFDLAGLHLFKSATTVFSIGLVTLLGERIALNARKKLFSSLIYKDLSFFDSHTVNDLTIRLSQDVQDLKHSVKQIMGKGVKSSIEMVGITARLFQLSTHLTSMLLGSMPIIYLASNIYASFLRQLSRYSKDMEAFASVVATEALGNMRTVKAYCAEEKEIEMYEKATQNAKKATTHLGMHIGLFQSMTSLSIGYMVLGLLYYGGQKVSREEMEAGDLMNYLLSVESAQKCLINFGELFAKSIQAVSSSERIFFFMNTKFKESRNGNFLQYINGDIKFENVDFKYPSRDVNVLSNISLEIPEGKIIALCGGSGGGKSTIVSLLEKFYSPTKGKIYIDGVDVNDLDTNWTRNQIGYITQDPILFAASIIDNIKYGQPNASIEDVYEAAKQANAHDFITAFPQGYNTLVGERGASLSGGQKQRISIARALLKNPKILVLDEATSSLDNRSEVLVQEAIHKLIKNKTVLIIAHRLSTIEKADQIIVLNQGNIVEKGTHSELLANHGFYYQLHSIKS